MSDQNLYWANRLIEETKNGEDLYYTIVELRSHMYQVGHADGILWAINLMEGAVSSTKLTHQRLAEELGSKEFKL